MKLLIILIFMFIKNISCQECKIEINNNDPNEQQKFNLKCYKNGIYCNVFDFYQDCTEKKYDKKYNNDIDNMSEEEKYELNEDDYWIEIPINNQKCTINMGVGLINKYDYHDFKGRGSMSATKGLKTLLSEHNFKCDEKISEYESCMSKCLKGPDFYNGKYGYSIPPTETQETKCCIKCLGNANECGGSLQGGY